MKKVKIEKGIPVPKQQRRDDMICPFDEMEAGDSCFIKAAESDVKQIQHTILILARRHFGTMKFTTRTVDGGLRVWRLS